MNQMTNNQKLQKLSDRSNAKRKSIVAKYGFTGSHFMSKLPVQAYVIYSIVYTKIVVKQILNLRLHVLSASIKFKSTFDTSSSSSLVISSF